MREVTTSPTRQVVLAGAPSPTAPGRLTRRRVLQLGFWTSLGALAAGGVASIVNSLVPRGIQGFGGPVTVLASDIPKPGDPPKQNIEGHFLLVNLEANEGRIQTDDVDAPGGLMALWWKCPHLGCTVPWKADYVAKEDNELNRRGWFNCNCHSSTYTKAGVRVRGPAPRSMDTMELTVAKSGDVTVQTGKRRNGDNDNPRRAVPWARPGAGT